MLRDIPHGANCEIGECVCARTRKPSCYSEELQKNEQAEARLRSWHTLSAQSDPRLAITVWFQASNCRRARALASTWYLNELIYQSRASSNGLSVMICALSYRLYVPESASARHASQPLSVYMLDDAKAVNICEGLDRSASQELLGLNLPTNRHR